MNPRQLITHFLELIEKQRIPLYCDRLGQPFIAFPLDAKKRPRPLRSQSVRSWISMTCFGLSHVPTSGEIEALLNVLEGHAWKEVRSGMADAELAHLVEQDPLLQAIVEFMDTRQQEQQVKMMTELFTELKTLAKTNGLLQVGRRKWPGSSWVLSRRLNELLPTLQRLGIHLEIRHIRKGSEVTLKKLPSFDPGDAQSVTASPTASPPNSGTPNGLRTSDASTPQTESIQSDLNPQTHKEKLS